MIKSNEINRLDILSRYFITNIESIFRQQIYYVLIVSDMDAESKIFPEIPSKT